MELTTSQQAAAFHGMATNRTRPTSERLELAMEGLRLYEKAMIERRDPVIQAVKDCVTYFRSMQEVLGPHNELPPAYRNLIAAWEAYSD